MCGLRPGISKFMLLEGWLSPWDLPPSKFAVTEPRTKGYEDFYRNYGSMKGFEMNKAVSKCFWNVKNFFGLSSMEVCH